MTSQLLPSILSKRTLWRLSNDVNWDWSHDLCRDLSGSPWLCFVNKTWVKTCDSLKWDSVWVQVKSQITFVSEYSPVVGNVTGLWVPMVPYTFWCQLSCVGPIVKWSWSIKSCVQKCIPMNWESWVGVHYDFWKFINHLRWRSTQMTSCT